MKKPLTILSNDWHLHENNGGTLLKVIRQKCELAQSLNLDRVFALGDLIHSRIAQRLIVLKNFECILDVFKEFNIELIAISGNHDKSDYTSSDSFLDAFKHHPNFTLHSDYGTYEIADGVRLHLLPFFKEEIYKEKLSSIDSFNLNDILLTHVGIEGSVNNDGTEHESILKLSNFDMFNKVLSGHYHNQGQVGKNFYHLPSIIQHNFGEDVEKGFTVLYDDLSHELIKSDFPQFKKIKVNIDEISKKELNSLTTKHSETGNDKVRFEFTGTQSKIKSLDKAFYQNLGIDVKTKVKEVEDTSVESTEEITVHNDNSLKEEFKEFCTKEELEYEQGIKYFE